MTDRLRAWMPEGGLGLAVLLGGLLEVVNRDVAGLVPFVQTMAVVAGVSSAVALSRRQPAAALGVLWVTAVHQA